jgi:hypothetical protein
MIGYGWNVRKQAKYNDQGSSFDLPAGYRGMRTAARMQVSFMD